MIDIREKQNCCGCTACENICPRNCIQMKEDFEGFLYPVVSVDKCVQCGLCNRVCPIENKDYDMQKAMQEEWKVKSVVMRTKNRDVLMGSTSGGFFTPFAEYIKKQQGVIFAAAYDQDFNVRHLSWGNGGVVNNNIPLEQFRGSKYVQSDTRGCFQKIKKLLDQDIKVGFVGTTCQVYGLKRFLKKEYQNLFTIDLVCHGTPSPKLWRKYVKYQAEKYGSSIKQISFRNKTYGYHSGTMKILFGNGKAYYGSARVDYMLKSFFSEIASRPSCYNCPYKFVNRCSDFTIYDCWHAADLVKGLNDDDRGYTNVIIQSQKGRATFEALKDRIEWYPADTDKAVSLDGIMIKKQPTKNPKRDEFYTDLDAHTLKAHIQKYIPVTRKDVLIEKSKIIFYRTGMTRVIKKVKD